MYIFTDHSHVLYWTDSRQTKQDVAKTYPLKLFAMYLAIVKNFDSTYMRLLHVYNYETVPSNILLSVFTAKL